MSSVPRSIYVEHDTMIGLIDFENAEQYVGLFQDAHLCLATLSRSASR